MVAAHIGEAERRGRQRDQQHQPGSETRRVPHDDVVDDLPLDEGYDGLAAAAQDRGRDSEEHVATMADRGSPRVGAAIPAQSPARFGSRTRSTAATARTRPLGRFRVDRAHQATRATRAPARRPVSSCTVRASGGPSPPPPARAEPHLRRSGSTRPPADRSRGYSRSGARAGPATRQPRSPRACQLPGWRRRERPAPHPRTAPRAPGNGPDSVHLRLRSMTRDARASARTAHTASRPASTAAGVVSDITRRGYQQ